MNFRVGTLRNRTEDKQPATRSEPGTRLGLLLTVCCVAQFMVILDLSIVNVALPSIQSDLGFTPVNLQWVVDAYAICFAGFLMLGGRASDRFGPRRMLAAALILFAFSSLAGGAATSQAMLIIARSLQGLSGALMAASSLAAIAMSFPQGPARHRAIALWGAMNGAGGAAGALLGGVITQEIGWRWVLLINPPIGVAAAGVAWAVIAEAKKREGPAPSFDLPGALTLTLGQMILVYGIVEAGTHGWGSPDFYVPVIIAVALFVLFSLIETRWASAPLVPFKAITKPLADANTIVFVFSAALFPMWFVSSLYLQEVLGLSPLNAGLAFFPMASGDHADRQAGGQARRPLRPASRADVRAGPAGQRDAAAREDRPDRQLPRLRRAAGNPGRGRHRPVRGRVDDRGNPVRAARSGWPGLRPGQYVQAGGRRARHRRADLARDVLHDPPDRAEQAGS